MTDFDLSDEPLEAAARRVAELFVELYSGLEDRPVAPAERRAAMEEALGGRLDEHGVGLLETIEEIGREVLPRAMTTPHPLYLGLVNSSPLPAGVLADLFVSALNNNAGAFHQSPAATVLEAEVVRSFAGLFGLPERTAGMLLPGGTYATLQGVLLARQQAFPEWQASGPAGLSGQPVLYSGAASHFSVARAAEVAGFGRHGIALLAGGGRGELGRDELAERLVADRRAGRLPFAVVASVGTTGTGAIDRLDEIADLCRDEGLWLHVDACYGGAAALLEELESRLAGVERADSIAVDPHKWFFVPMTAGLLLNRHPELELATFDPAGASYIPASEGDVAAFRRGVPTSRRASSLTVWAALRAHGWKTVRTAVRRNIALTRRLESGLAAAGFRVLAGGELSIACARWEPAGKPPDELDAVQQVITDAIVASGAAWFSTVRFADRLWMRFNLVNLHTRERHVDRLVELLTAAARKAG